MTREEVVANYLRGNATLRALAPGGIYPDAIIPDPDGLSNAKLMPKVWAGGVFNTTVVVRQAAAVPTGDLQGVSSKRTSMSQVIEVWVYSEDTAAIEAVFAQVYTLMMGKKIGDSFRATQGRSGAGIRQAPDLPPGIKTNYEGYRIVFIRRPVTA